MARAQQKEPIPKEELRRMRKAFASRAEGDRVHMFKTLADTLVPGWFEWHSWTERFLRGACYERWMGVAGCANAAKTRNAAGIGAMLWLCNPRETSVVFCSTTMKMLRKRGWAEIQNFRQ